MLQCWDVIRKLHWLESKSEAVSVDLAWPGLLLSSGGQSDDCGGAPLQHNTLSPHLYHSNNYQPPSHPNRKWKNKTIVFDVCAAEDEQVTGSKVMIIVHLSWIFVVLFCYSFVGVLYCVSGAPRTSLPHILYLSSIL